MCLELFGQRGQLCHGMVMADSLAGCFPHVLLRIHVWCRHRKLQNFEARMGIHEGANRSATMPGGAAGTLWVQQQNRLVRISR